MSTVEYLNPETQTWVQRTAEDTLDMVADPFWRTRQSSTASKDAIVVRCGVGFVKRSTDGGENWTDITPTTDPPNDEGDSPAPTKTTVTYQAMDASVVSISNFFVLVNWQNSSSEWRSWVAKTTNDGTSWIWKYLGEVAGGGLPQIEFEEAIGFNDTGWGPQYMPLGYRGEDAQQRGNCVLSATKAIHISVQCFEDNPDFHNDLVAFIITMDSGGAITGVSSGTAILDSDESEPGRCCIVALTSTKFLVAYIGYYALLVPPYTVGFPLRAKICDLVGGTSISVGSQIEFGTQEDLVGSFDAVVLNSTTVAFPMVWGSATANPSEMAVRVLYGISGQSGTPGSLQQLSDGRNYRLIKGSQMDSNGRFVVHMCQDDGVEDNGWAVGVRHTGSGTCSFGTPDMFDELLPEEEGSWHIVDAFGVRLTDTKWVVCYWRAPGNTAWVKRIGILNPTTLAVSFTGNMHGSLYNEYQSVARIADNEFVIVARDANDEVRVRRHDVIGSTISHYSLWFPYSYPAFTKSMYIQHGPFLNRIPGTDMFLVSQNLYDSDGDWGALGVTDCDGFSRAWTFEAPPAPSSSATEPRGLGISAGKATNSNLYVTVHGGEDLRLLDINISDLSFVSYILGLATEADVTARMRYALPFADFSGEDSVTVFGNMDDPYSLGDPAHIIYSDDAGVTASLVENGWSIDHCGALLITPNGIMIGIRNRNVQAKLYMDNNDFSMLLKMTMPFDNDVQPHGMAYDYIDGTLYICSGDGDSYMVLRINAPYTSLKNITYNHGNVESINSVAIL